MTRTGRPAVVLAVVGFGMFVAADDLTVASTLLRQIVGDLRLPLPERIDDAAWIVNAYLVAYVAVMPIAGRLSDAFGRRSVFVAGLVLFGIGSAFIPFTTSLGPFLFWRVITAIGGGAMVPVALATVADVYRAERRGRALGALGAIETLGWVWGPLFGAALVRFLDWRWQFYLNVPLALGGIVVAWIVLGGVGRPDRARRLQMAGPLLLSAALVALTIGLLQMGEIASTPELSGIREAGGWPAWPFFLVAGSATIGFVIAERRSTNPLIGPAIAAAPNARAALVANLLVGAVLAVAMVNIPLFVNLVVEPEIRSAAVLSGWVLTALTAAMAMMALVGGRLTDRLSYRTPTLAGTALATTALALMGTSWNVAIGGVPMAIHAALVGAGIGLVTAPLTAAVVEAVREDRRGAGTALVVISRLIGLTLGLTGLTAWVLHRFDTLRATITLPPLTDPGYAEAAEAAQRELTASVLAETFIAAALIAALATLVAGFLRRDRAAV